MQWCVQVFVWVEWVGVVFEQCQWQVDVLGIVIEVIEGLCQQVGIGWCGVGLQQIVDGFGGCGQVIKQGVEQVWFMIVVFILQMCFGGQVVFEQLVLCCVQVRGGKFYVELCQFCWCLFVYVLVECGDDCLVIEVQCIEQVVGGVFIGGQCVYVEVCWQWCVWIEQGDQILVVGGGGVIECVVVIVVVGFGIGVEFEQGVYCIGMCVW